MSYRRFARFHSHAVRLALTAMLLLVTGPVIGQLSALYEPAHHRDASPSARASTTSAQHHSIPEAIGWHAQCGYCSLTQHVPVLGSAASPASPLRPSSEPSLVAPRLAHGTPGVFPHALTRAPPVVIG